ncbi:Thioredoxin [Paenibacillus sp. NFR01]|nr:Thioredoxin [Paenibacillus sp. NFR01]
MNEMEQKELLELIGQAGAPLVVFGYTPICGTCKVALRMLEIAGTMLPSEVTLVKANLNLMPQLVSQYKLSSVPVLMAAPADRSGVMNILYRMGSVQHVLDYIRRVALL